MLQALDSLHERLAPAEEIFFPWLMRVFAGATLVGSAFIDDAPPLEFGALIIGLYVAARVASQFGALVNAAPFRNRVLKTVFAIVAIAVLGLAFLTVVTFVETVALSALG